MAFCPVMAREQVIQGNALVKALPSRPAYQHGGNAVNLVIPGLCRKTLTVAATTVFFKEHPEAVRF